MRKLIEILSGRSQNDYAILQCVADNWERMYRDSKTKIAELEARIAELEKGNANEPE